MEGKIISYLNACMNHDDLPLTSAVRCAKALKASRVDVTACMNKLVQSNDLVRILSRPYLYVPVSWLSEHYIYTDQSEFASVSEFMQLFEKQTTNTQDPFDQLVGNHHSLKPMISQLKAAISYPPEGLPILLKGPTGTGKSKMAALAYDWAKQKGLLKEGAQFVQLNCSEYANNPELLNASLFGYVKGAFTGADKDTSGLAALADGGILFLDEVHNLSAQSQEKLFHLMDQGIYHQMGDNENTLYSHCRMIFATTEDPDQVLLRTLMRRIPIVIEIPSLKERGRRERIALIARLIEQEQKRLNRPIQLSGSVYDLLLNAEVPGNIGELKSIIQFCCVNAFFEADSLVRINLHHVPYKLISQRSITEAHHQNVLDFYTVEQLFQLYDKDQKAILFSNQLLELFQERNAASQDVSASLILQMRVLLMKHLDERIEESSESEHSYCWMALNQAFTYLQGKSQDSRDPARLLALAWLIQEICFNDIEYQNWSICHEDECQLILNELEKTYFKTFRSTQEICLFLQSAVELYIYPMVIIIIFLFLIDPIEQDVYKGRALLIAAHGFSTASSIADAANQLLGDTVFDAIDMPITSSVDDVIEKVQTYAGRFPHLEELILLVDMGSLESILDGLNSLECSIGLIDHVSTPVALEIGTLVSQREELESMLDKVCKLSCSGYRLRPSMRKKPAIVCCCASGIGTARRLESLIQSSLPSDCDIRVLSVSYPHLLQEKKSSSVFQKWNVVCLVGTLNPNLKDVTFISVEDLIIRDHFILLESCLEGLFTKEQSAEFQKKLLKNFSLYNLMSELTVLNPQKLLEQITPCVEQLQNDLKITLSSTTCIGLYVHISCLIERIAFNQTEAKNQNLDLNPDLPANPELRRFIRLCRECFRSIESQYRVRIPDSEIAYIYEYIRHDSQNEDSETADF